MKQSQTWQARFRKARLAHWNSVAQQQGSGPDLGRYYHRYLARVYRFLISPQQRILEIGCGVGDLLAALDPAVGVGVDISPEMIKLAQGRHPQLHFIQADAHNLTINGEFDVIILSDLVNDLWDVQQVLEQISPLTTPNTRIILNFYSRLWELPLALASQLQLAHPTLYQNWLTVEDIDGLLQLADFEVIRVWREFLWPLPTPIIDTVFNRVVAKIWPFNHLALTNFVLARPKAPARPIVKKVPLVSVIIPARNEAGNIPQIFDRVPEMGRGTELVFIEGHSQDDTYAVIQQEMARHPKRKSQLHQQTGVGKGDAVRLGFSQANGDILMILDADLTVPPEDLPRFYNALLLRQGEFINGVRLVYPMENEAMRYFNLWGNKFFSLAFSWLLGQPIKDTLCGTKVLWRDDYELIVANRNYFGNFDPFGDFDLIFGAAKLGLKIIDLPIRYRQRTYGATNIDRWKHGWLLLRMVLFAAGRIKFI